MVSAIMVASCIIDTTPQKLGGASFKHNGGFKPRSMPDKGLYCMIA